MTLMPMKICGHLLKTPLKKRWFRAGLACLIFTASARAGYGRITNMMRWLVIAFLVGLARLQAAPAPELAPELWTSAQQSADIHRFSTLFTVQCVHSYLSSETDMAEAIRWCKASGVTKVYLEEYRDGQQAERQTLMRARDRFRAAGFLVSGCVTTTGIGKPSEGGSWKSLSCFTDAGTQNQVQAAFEFAASLFDEIMIDDFLCTACTCSECDAARQKRVVTIGSKTYPVTGDTWADYRCELMLRVSQDRLLAAAKRINPKVRLIIKYPNWYDEYQERGYDVVRETAAFDRIWVGTETRDYTDPHWGGIPQYEGYFLMRWLGGIGGEKCGGGWYDWLGTTEHTYVEQARQTVLGGARESMLFCYRGLHNDTGPADIAALRTNIPELLAVAREVRRREPVGMAAYKPPNSSPQEERCVFDFVGMMGLPLVPCHEFPTNAPAAFLSVDALADTNLVAELGDFIQTRRPLLLTDGLARRIAGRVNLLATNVHVLAVRGQPGSLLTLPQARLDDLRAPLLGALGATFQAPNRVALYLFTQGGWVVENFNDAPVEVVLKGQRLSVDARGWLCHWK
jgi:hypothetical protein